MKNQWVSFAAIAIAATWVPAANAGDVYTGEPYGEALFELLRNSALPVSHELSSASGNERTDVFRLPDGRLLAVTSRADKLETVFSIVKLRVTTKVGGKLTKKLPTVDSVELPKKAVEAVGSGGRR